MGPSLVYPFLVTDNRQLTKDVTSLKIFDESIAKFFHHSDIHAKQQGSTGIPHFKNKLNIENANLLIFPLLLLFFDL